MKNVIAFKSEHSHIVIDYQFFFILSNLIINKDNVKILGNIVKFRK